jgi:tRNA1(Val) A37 N6-methylase TrmN6
MLPATVDSTEDQRLAQLDVARRALSQARTLPEVKLVRDKAAVVQQFFKQQRASLAMQNDIAEIKVRAERKAGALLAEMPLHGGDRKSSSHDENLKLADVGISQNESHRWQQEASLPEAAFEAYVATTKQRGQELTSKGVYELARQTAKQAQRQANVTAEQAPIDPALVTLLHGEFQTCGATLTDASVDAVICDPPYGDDWACHLDVLGALAARVLKPGGSLLLLYGQRSLRHALETLDRHLAYQWVLAYRLHGHGQAVWGHRVQNHWKPLLWYVQGAYTGGMIGDVVETGPVPEKDHHDWQQSEDAFCLLVKRFTQPGDLILDPCCGSGTTGVAAVSLRRRFVGIDCDQAALAQAHARLAVLSDAAAD